MKLRWTPRSDAPWSSQCTRKTPYVMLAQLDSSGATVEAGSAEKEMSDRSGASSRGRALTTQEEKPRAGPSPPRRRQGAGRPSRPAADPARLPLPHLVGRNARSLLKRLDLGPARLGRHFPPSQNSSATDRSLHGQSAVASAGQRAGLSGGRPAKGRGDPAHADQRASGWRSGRRDVRARGSTRAPPQSSPRRAGANPRAGRGDSSPTGPNRRLRAPRLPGAEPPPRSVRAGEARPSASVRASSQCVMINSPYQTLAVPPA